MWFDLIFVAIFLFLEYIYYVSFRKFEGHVVAQLDELNKRLEIIIERDEDRNSFGKMWS